MEKLKIELKEYWHKCGDGCCDIFGTVTTVNGVELPSHNQDVVSILESVISHLGYEVEIEHTFSD